MARLAERWGRAGQNLKGATEAPILPDLRFVAYRRSHALVADGAPAVGQEELNEGRGAVAYLCAKKSVNIWDHAVDSSQRSIRVGHMVEVHCWQCIALRNFELGPNN